MRTLTLTRTLLVLSTGLVLAAGGALAHGCPGEMKAIDDKLATSPKLTDAELAQVKKLRSEGEAAHKAGNHDASMKSLGEAKKILKI